MKVLHVTDADLPGRRFSGYDLLDDLLPRGVEGSQAVLHKFSRDPRVTSLFTEAGDEELHNRLEAIEAERSVNNLLYPWARRLVELPAFQSADVVHYHLIHNRVLSLYDIGWLVGLKPSVWSFHDPWVFTGHCVHPIDSTGWLTGCSPCPYLDRQFSMRDDRASQMWTIKQQLFSELDIDVVVSSEWMRDMVRRSPITAHLANVHLIPFGVEAGRFVSTRSSSENRRRLRIPDGDFVVLLRASGWEAKGLQYALAALNLRPPSRPTTVLTVDRQGLVDSLSADYRVVELGWVDDQDLYAAALSASDVLLMPSVAESFGLMAVEAMAAGRPVVCFDGTAVAGVARAPDCGVAVPLADSAGLRVALDELANDPGDRRRRGDLGQTIVANEYGQDRYLDALTSVYKGAQARLA